MLSIAGTDKVYLACGSTDMRKSIDCLAAIVQQSFALDVFCKRNFLTFAKIFPQAPVGKFYVNPSNFSSKISYV